MTLDIPDEVRAESSLDKAAWEREAKKELALAFYARGLLSVGFSARLAGATRMEFEDWLSERQIVRPFSEAEIDCESA